MKSILPLVTAAALAATGFAADAPAPPPPPAESSPAPSSTGGKAGLAAGAHHPFVGILKEVQEKGKVTKEEFLSHAKKQAEEAFAKLDKNNDGVIDKSEVAEIEDRLKGARGKMQERGKGGKGDGTRKRPASDAKPDATKPAA